MNASRVEAAPGGTSATPSGPLVRFAQRLSKLKPRSRFAASFGFGALASLAMPPLGAAPVLLVSFPGLIWLMAGVRTFWGAFGAGWAFTFGFLLLGLYWVPVSMLVDPAFYWMIPFTAAGLPAGMALYHGLALAVWWRLPFSGVGQVIAFAVFWSVAEWLRGHLLTGFPLAPDRLCLGRLAAGHPVGFADRHLWPQPSDGSGRIAAGRLDHALGAQPARGWAPG